MAPRAAEIDRTEAYPWDNVEALDQGRLHRHDHPEGLGGQGPPYLDAVLVIEQMARTCGVTGRIVVEANMGAIGAIMAYGTETQKQLAAELVLAGDKPAICITEPEAGSAATEMTTARSGPATVTSSTARKYWITGGGVSRLHLIFARVIESGIDQGIGGFIAIRDESKGLRVGAREPAMGLRGIPETYLHFENLEVPDGAGCANAGRVPARLRLPHDRLQRPAGRCGDRCPRHRHRRLELRVARAKEREQFGRPLAEFQGLQWMLADCSIGLAAARPHLHGRASEAGGGFPDLCEAAQAKILASETAIKVNDALQIHGAMGYSRNLPLERMARDARMFTIGGGTAQLLRNQVAGAILGMKLPQTRDGYAKAGVRRSEAAE